VLRELQAELGVLDELVREPWVQGAAPAAVPQLADILTLQLAETDLRHIWAAQPRLYDEKFHILQAPQLRWHDLGYFREACALRDRDLGLGFVDIDNFGAFNKALTEPMVDELVLPRFMRALEAAVFGRGFAYRMGGDEYVLLLPNVDTAELRSFLGGLRETVEHLRYPSIDRNTTVSIGYVVVPPHASMTNREVIRAAATAKATAKDAGRNRIAGFDDGYCDPRPAHGVVEAMRT